MSVDEKLAVLTALPPEVAASLRAIRDDNLRGAAALSRDAALLVKRAVSQPSFPPWPEARPVLAALCRGLVDAQPTMAPLFNLANNVLLAAESVPDHEDVGRAVIHACEEFDTHVRVALIRIARLANSLLPDGQAVLTHSASQTVLAAFEEARLEGKRLSVFCTESRPQREGLDMARRLADIGCRVRFVVDAAADRALDQVSLVLVGADAISREGLTNKIGTSLLALAAATKGKPVYALCGTDKWLPGAWTLPPEPPKPADEVLDERGGGVEVLNYYFNVCPLADFTAIVSEEGLLSPEEVRARLEEREVHPALLCGRNLG